MAIQDRGAMSALPRPDVIHGSPWCLHVSFQSLVALTPSDGRLQEHLRQIGAELSALVLRARHGPLQLVGLLRAVGGLDAGQPGAGTFSLPLLRFPEGEMQPRDAVRRLQQSQDPAPLAFVAIAEGADSGVLLALRGLA